MQGSGKTALRQLGWRFVWMTLVLFTAMILGIWAGSAFFPQLLGLWGDYDYVVGTTLIAAVMFGGLYAAAAALWPATPERRNPSGAR